VLYLKVLNPDTLEPVGPGEMGEFCSFHKDQLSMIKYINQWDAISETILGFNCTYFFAFRPAKTKEFFSAPGGFCRSGDLVSYEEDGTIKYIDRLKEVIK